MLCSPASHHHGFSGARQQLISTALAWGLPVVLAVASGGPVDLRAYVADDRVSAIVRPAPATQDRAEMLRARCKIAKQGRGARQVSDDFFGTLGCAENQCACADDQI